MRVLEPCYYFSHKSADLTYTFSKWSKPWNYTILKNPDRPRSHRVLLTRFLCSVLSRRPQVANKVTPFPDSDGGLENRPTFHRVFLAKNKVVLENLRAIYQLQALILVDKIRPGQTEVSD